MELKSWELRDPEKCVRELARAHEPRPARVVVGLIEHPSHAQRLIRSRVIYDEFPWPAGEFAGREIVHDAAHELFAGFDQHARRPQHSFVTMITRPGRVVFTRDDFTWALAWRYSNHLLPVFQGDIFLVTEHGWRSLAYDDAGTSPCLDADSLDDHHETQTSTTAAATRQRQC